VSILLTHVVSSHIKSLYWVMSAYSAKFADSCSCRPAKKVCGGVKDVVPANASRTFVSRIGIPDVEDGPVIAGDDDRLFPFLEELDDRFRNDLFIANKETTSDEYGAIYINRSGRYEIQVNVSMVLETPIPSISCMASLVLSRTAPSTSVLLGSKQVPFIGGRSAYVDINAVYDLRVGDLIQLTVEQATDPPVIIALDMSTISLVEVGLL